MTRKNTKREDHARRVLFELSATEDGGIEVWMDRTLKPVQLLAVIAALDTAQQELRDCIIWSGGGDE